jgi:hypothetical protein
MDGNGEIDFDGASIERAALNETPEGQVIAAEYVAMLGRFVTDRVRPLLREVAADGREPQLLVNGLADLMRRVADSIELPIGAPRPSPDEVSASES